MSRCGAVVFSGHGTQAQQYPPVLCGVVGPERVFEAAEVERFHHSLVWVCWMFSRLHKAAHME
jgi:hypothetical protein